MTNETTVIVGASVAGVRTARALRLEGYDGKIVLIGAESELPYDKPPLSKGLLDASKTLDDVRLLTAAAAADAKLELRLGQAAIALHPSRSMIELADGSEVAYDDLVIATGASARPSPWGEHPDVHVLRTAHDAARLRSAMVDGRRMVVVGAGFIGCEVAAAAMTAGLEVTVVDPLTVPMSRILGSHVGSEFAELYRRHGVDLRLGTGVDDISRDDTGLAVVLADGERLAADLVVVGIGARPNDEWLAGSGLAISDGVLCDEFGRAQGMRRVFAVGDVASWRRPGTQTHERAEHWTSAVEQAGAVAATIAHPAEPVGSPSMGYVWSDQLGWKIQVVGSPPAGETHCLVRGSGDSFAAIYSDHAGSATGVVTVNWPGALMLCRRRMSEGTTSSRLLVQLVGNLVSTPTGSPR